MRVHLVIVSSLLSLGLACTPAPSEVATPTPAPPAPTPAPEPTAAPKPRAAAMVGDPALADHWLVILASKRDPAEAAPAIEAVRAHPEVKTSPQTLLSSRYKNLMPCYTVAFAAATVEKAEAVALSKQLKGVGIDNYVKNTGPWIGPSAAIDSYCERAAAAPAGGAVMVLADAGGSLYAPTDLLDSVEMAILERAPAPHALSSQFDQWLSPLAIENAGTVTKGAKLRAIEVGSGREVSCTVDSFDGLTLGTPHFGVLQADTPPSEPSCGRPAVYAALACEGTVAPGNYVATAEGTAMSPYAPAGSGNADMVEAAKAALTADTDWEDDPPNPDESEVERTASVGLWRGPDGVVAVVEGLLSVGGVCGGDETTWSAVYATDGTTLGARYGKFTATSFSTMVGVIDVDGDKVPERVIRSFPDDTSVIAFDGKILASHAVDFCDCPC